MNRIVLALLALSVCFANTASAQAATRPVALGWAPSSSQGITGYVIQTGTSANGPFTQIGCTGTVTGSACVSGTTASTLAFTDPSETIGATIYYQVEAAGPSSTVIATQATQATVGSATITIPTALSGLAPGAAVSGTGIAAGTTVVGVNGTTITLSVGITAALAASSVTFTTTCAGCGLSPPLTAVYTIPPKNQSVFEITLSGL